MLAKEMRIFILILTPMGAMMAFSIGTDYETLPFTESLLTLIGGSSDPFYAVVMVEPVNKIVFNMLKHEVNELLRSMSAVATYKLSVNEFDNQLEGHFIYFTDGYASFLKTFEITKNSDQQRASDGIFVLLPPQNEVKNQMQTVKSILTKLYELKIERASIFVRESLNVVAMYSSFLYLPDSCGKIQVKLINRFHNGQPERKPKFPERCENLNKCKLKVFGYEVEPYFMLQETRLATDQRATILSGLDGELLKILADKMNFTIELVGSKPYLWGQVSDKGNMTGVYQKLKQGLVDVHMGFSVHKVNRMNYFDVSNSYFSTDFVGVIKRKSYLTGDHFDWIYTPFRPETWATLGVCILLIGIVIWLRTWRHQKLERFSLLMSITFGMTARPQLKNSLDHILFVTLSLALFAFRSAYVGMIYYSYNHREAESTPKTISNLILKNYTVLSHVGYFDEVTKRHISPTPNLPTSFGAFDYWRNFPDTQKTALLLNYGVLINFLVKGNHFSDYVSIPEPLLKHHLCAYLQKYSSLTKCFNIVMGKLLSAGIVAKWVKIFNLDESWKIKYRRLVATKAAPVAITVKNLRLAFLLLASCLFVATLVFLVEITMKLGRKLKLFKKLNPTKKS